MSIIHKPDELARLIDHTLLKADATARQVETLCREALENRFHAVCVNGSRVELARSLVEDSEVKVAAVVGFPLGASFSDVKVLETEGAIDHGAHEIDVVLNIGRLKDGDRNFVLRELRDVVEAADERPVKVILETSLLNADETILACELVVESGANFVKTSTGFGPEGATPSAVKLLRQQVGPKFGVKASGGIRDLEMALAMVEAGASRIGTSSGVAILKAFRDRLPAKGA